MLNKLKFLIFLLRIQILILVVRLIGKYLLDSHPSHKFLSGLKFRTEGVITKNLRSNHVRRFLSVIKLLNENLKIKNFSKIVTRIDDDNLSFIFWPKLSSQYQVYLVGDSHSEFYGRSSKLASDLDKVSPSVLWLGPRTFMGLYFSANLDKYIENCFSEIENIEKGEPVCGRYFAFSIGSIDIRTLFTQLTKFGPRLTEDELMEKFENAVRYFFEEFILVFRRRWPDSKVGIFEILFCTKSLGESFSTEKDLKNHLRVMPYPILGSYVQRSKWCDAVNHIIVKMCKEFDVDFLPVNKHLENYRDKTLGCIDSYDDAHVTNQITIDRIFMEVMARIGNKNVD